MHHIWLFSRSIDLCVLGMPVWITWAICFAMPEHVIKNDLPLWVWAVFIVGIDVSHVWSTLFRTYLDREEFAHHRTVLLRTPRQSIIRAAQGREGRGVVRRRGASFFCNRNQSVAGAGCVVQPTAPPGWGGAFPPPRPPYQKDAIFSGEGVIRFYDCDLFSNSAFPHANGDRAM